MVVVRLWRVLAFAAVTAGCAERAAPIATVTKTVIAAVPPAELSFAARAPDRTRVLARAEVRGTEVAAQLGALSALVPECGLELRRDLERVEIAIAEPLELRIDLTGKVPVAAGECVVAALERRGALGRVRLGVSQLSHGIRIATAGARADGSRSAALLTLRFEELSKHSKYVLLADLAPGGLYEAWGTENNDMEVRIALGSPQAAARAATWVEDAVRGSPELSALTARADGATLSARVPRVDRDPALSLKREVIEAFRTPSESMAPTLIAGDHVFVAKGPSARAVARGDIVVFKSPKDESQVFLKRVIGIGGDRVQIDGDVVRVNGVAVETAPGQESLGDHHYRVAHEPGLGTREAVDATVPAASLFLVGDNRDNSFDSRQFGAVPLESVKGRVVLIWASFGEETVRWERFGIVPD